MALCLSTAEYASPVWGRYVHSKQIDVTLNEICRLVTGCLRNTKVEKIYVLAGITPPAIRRAMQADWERTKMAKDDKHPMQIIEANNFRLKQKQFLKKDEMLNNI